VPAELLASAGQFGPVPGQCSAGSHSPAESRQTVLDDLKASAGQTVLDPVQFSSTSQAPAAARHTAPALPAGCWQVTFVPSHRSSVHALPSEVHTVPLAFLASVGQLGPFPDQFSARSHSSAATRHTVLEERKPSAGQLPLDPLQVSCTSQLPATGRQTVPAATKVQVVVQHDVLEPLAVPSSHCSPAVVSTLPSPQTDILPTSMNPHRHFDEVPGIVSLALLHVWAVLLSQLRQVPTSRIPLPSLSLQTMLTVPPPAGLRS